MQAIEEPFVVAVREALGDRFTSRVETIYRKTIKFILHTLTTGFEHRDDPSSVQHGLAPASDHCEPESSDNSESQNDNSRPAEL